MRVRILRGVLMIDIPNTQVLRFRREEIDRLRPDRAWMDQNVGVDWFARYVHDRYPEKVILTYLTDWCSDYTYVLLVDKLPHVWQTVVWDAENKRYDVVEEVK